VTTAGKKLWNSETGDSDGTGLTLASNLCLDFRWLHPTAWVYWQVMDPSAGWAMIAYDPSTLQPTAVQTKYYVMAQFSRHIRPGMTILDTGVGYAVAAHDAPRSARARRRQLRRRADPHLRPVTLRPGHRRQRRARTALVHADGGRRRPVRGALGTPCLDGKSLSVPFAAAVGADLRDRR
jgi:hypothetical protein